MIAALAVIGSSCKGGCAGKSSPASDTDPAKRVEASAAAEKRADKGHSVYPDKVTPDPVAVRFCDAVHTMAFKRRQACCAESAGIVVTSECVRMLTTAIQSKAISVATDDITRCEAAVHKGLDGCRWVGTWPFLVPSSCEHILHGQLARDAVCRSALECKDGLRCEGLRATEPGHCREPGGDGALCGGATDPLAVYARQDNAEIDHPICAGFCDRSRCAASRAEGGACRANVECGLNGHCAGGRCVKGRHPKVGEPCTAGGCEPPARCIASVCRAPKPEGEACTLDDECRGGCVKGSEGATGVCQPVCETIIGLKRVRRVLTGTAVQGPG